MTASIRVLIADDHPIIAEGIRTRLTTNLSVSIVGTAQTFAETIELAHQLQPDVIILDLSGMKGSVLATVAHLQRDYPTIRIVVFSSNVSLAPELMKAGVRGYVAKDDPTRFLPAAIERVHLGERFYSPAVQEYMKSVSSRQRLAGLTASELTVLKLLSQGQAITGVAKEMLIDRRTVSNKLTSIREKTGCIEITQMVDWYRMMVDPGNG